MRYALIAAMALAAASPAYAGNKEKTAAAGGPTLAQCQAGWQADYQKMWTEAQFKTACDALLKN